MIDNLARDLQILWKADSLIGKIWLDVMARRFGLYAVAALIAVFGLGMANVAGFYALQQAWGPVWAAAIVAVADFVLAIVVLLFGRNAAPGPEIELAFDVRKMAITSLQTDVQDLRRSADALGQEIRRTTDTVAGFIHHPLDAATDKLLVPLALSIVRSLRAKKE